MTLVHFNYTDSYNKASRGSLAFTPHRRHAANETEILPKPVTVPIVNGEVTVDLQPNPSTWVWIITEYFEQHSESFYTTIPDRDGVIEAVDLTRINPSTIPAPYNAVEPVWWAEMRQYKQTVTDTLLQSEEALTEAKEAIELGSESIEQTQHNASLAKAYAVESREDSYKSREYRDEAEQWRDEAKEQADRAASGPESAAQRAEDAAESASNSESASRGFRDEARDSASDARSSETSASGSASTATERASDARNEANRAESEAARAEGYADDLLAGPSDAADRAEAARDLAEEYRDDANTHAQDANQYREDAHNSSQSAQQHYDDTASIEQRVADIADTLKPFSAAILTGGRLNWSLGDFPSNTHIDVESYEDEHTYGSAVTVENGKITVQESGYYSVSASLRTNGAHEDYYTDFLIRSNNTQNVAQHRTQGFSTPGATLGMAAALFDEGDEIWCAISTGDRNGNISPHSDHMTSLRVARLG